MKTNALLLVALALAACSPDFDPASKVDKLRVLAIRAEPPEIEPAGPGAVAPDTAALRALVVRPDFATNPRKITVVYLACLPVPGVPGATYCEDLAPLRDAPAALPLAAGASCAPPPPGTIPPVAFAGAEECDARGASCTPIQLDDATPVKTPALTVPAGYALDTLPQSIVGAQAVVLAFALDATRDQVFQGAAGACPLAAAAERFSSLWSEPGRGHVLSLKRVQIRGPDAVDPPNQNPVVTGIADAAGMPLPATLPAHDVDLTPTPGDVAALEETYTKYFASGEVETANAKEDWVYSWFSTAGEMEDLHTRPPASERWKIGPEYSWSGSAGSATGGAALVAAVVRDLRGGVQWTVQEVTLGP